nr:L-erythro-3,5-diaminohexanoate dehydrogenase [Archangium lipolyticum]
MIPDPYGLKRVIGERGVLPQRAKRLDPSLPCRESELLIDVERLNVDAASFQQLRDSAGGDPARIAQRIREIVQERGKMHNPVTGSGGMLIGRVKEVGPKYPARKRLKVGDRVASMVSLTLTPLQLEGIDRVNVDNGQVDVRGHAILFATGHYAKLPDDLPEALALAALDVCGAPALIHRFVSPGMTVGVLGAGKGGALSLTQARRSLGGHGRLIALDASEDALALLSGLGLCDAALRVDATQAVEAMEKVCQATGGEMCDLVVNCASVGNTEMATLLATRAGGMAIFFSMATSFTTAALGADGIGKDVTILVGNGYVPGHVELTLDLLRTEPALRQFFEERYRV